MTDASIPPQEPAPAARVRWTHFESERVAELWMAGVAATDIAAALGKSRDAIVCKVARLGLRRGAARGKRSCGRIARPASRPARRHPLSWDSDSEARFLRYWGEGLSPDEIATRLGCPEAVIVDRATAAGLATVEAPERHVSRGWFARNNARFCSAMQRAIDRGLVVPPDDVATAQERSIARGRAEDAR